MAQTTQEKINAVLAPFNVEVRFGAKALEDLQGYKKQQQNQIVALIIAQGMKGPLIRPDGLGHPLHGELVGFAKIKPKHLGLRIVYRPKKNGGILMEVIAIGPRDSNQVYKVAAQRLIEFKMEMRESPS